MIIPPIPASAVDVAVWVAAAGGPAGAVIAMTMVGGVSVALVSALLPVDGIKGDTKPQAAKINAVHSTAKKRTKNRCFLRLIPSSNFQEPFSTSVILL